MRSNLNGFRTGAKHSGYCQDPDLPFRGSPMPPTVVAVRVFFRARKMDDRELPSMHGLLRDCKGLRIMLKNVFVRYAACQYGPGQNHNLFLSDWDSRKKWAFGCAKPGKQETHYLLNFSIEDSGGAESSAEKTQFYQFFLCGIMGH